jgi:tRNA A-37 threonylcarbamoyl transferase component Bud32
MEVKYTREELEEIRRKAKWFKIKNFWRLPSLIRGHKVASRDPESQIRNFSTITTCFSLSTGRWIYLVYSYPLSIIHRILDGLMKWTTEKYCIKVISPRKWKEAFGRNSFIPIIPVNIPNMVVMPYVNNKNLFDIMAGKVGKYSFPEKEAMIGVATNVINEMHAKDIVWGEPIVQNIIRSQDGEIILCDTETVYYRGTIIEQKVSDWLDFICSAVGAVSRLHPEKISYLVRFVVDRIQDEEVRQSLKERCRKKRTFLHRLFFLNTQVRLACPPKLYERIKAEIASA